LKGIPSASINAEVEARLVDVCLEDAADVLSSQYSGGMQRRLSLAIALLGDPKVVFLDEPTTGMDPVTRRKVWDTINRVKKGRCVILTTHSMEEAEILGDRVAVMSGGRLSCIGSSLHLKNKFGGGFRLSVVCNDPLKADKAQAMICDEAHGVNASFVSKTQDVLLFKLGTHDSALLSPFFEKIENARSELGISDVSIGNATLNDVFINLSVAEAKSDDKLHPDEVGQRHEELDCRDKCYNCCFKPSRFCGDCGDCSCCCRCCPVQQAPEEGGEGEVAVKKTSAGSTPKGQVYALVQKSLAFQVFY
jgi:energy-coupling factor transporter ATP-binding protein EcfA2